MNILFISGVAAGGASKSTVELARILAHRGHEVRVLLTDRPSDRSLFGVIARAHLKSADLPFLGEVTRRVMRAVGRRVRSSAAEPDLGVFHGTVAENGARDLIDEHRPDVVVANSLPRIGLVTLMRNLAGEIPVVLYMREAHSITHLSISGLRPAAIVANARDLCDQVAALGLQATFVPSIIDLDAASAATTRRAVMLVNPISENRPELLVGLARARPDTTFVLQESWPLSAGEKAELGRIADTHENLEFRAAAARPAAIYADTRLLIATYPSGRPRVVVEAQYNGIPVIALDQPSLAEAIGPLDRLVPADASDDDWLAAVAAYLDDEDFYALASESAAEWARRPEISPEQIAVAFERTLEGVLQEAPAQ